MILNEIINDLNSCSSVEQIKSYKEEQIRKMDIEHTEKMNKFNEMKAQHDAELNVISKEIREAIASKDFNLVKDLLKKQSELIAKQNAELLSVM